MRSRALEYETGGNFGLPGWRVDRGRLQWNRAAVPPEEMARNVEITNVGAPEYRHGGRWPIIDPRAV